MIETGPQTFPRRPGEPLARAAWPGHASPARNLY